MSAVRRLMGSSLQGRKRRCASFLSTSGRGLEKVEMCLIRAARGIAMTNKPEGGVRPNGLPGMQLFDLVVHTIPKEALLQMWTRLGVVSDLRA